MDNIERGEQIFKAFYKAAISALLSIGVKSTQNIDKFSNAFSQAIDQEFEKIGMLNVPTESSPPSPTPPEPKRLIPISEIKLSRLTERALVDMGFTTVDSLMLYMQEHSLTTIKGIREKRAKEILEALKLWNQS